MQIAKGGQGRVFLLTRRADGELLVCKTVKAGEEADREAQNLRRMQGNPGFVALHEIIYEASSGWHHLVMEFCECTLRDRVERAGVMVEAEAACLLKSLAKSVQDLHSRGILHRDIKQENVLLTSGEPPYEFKICDLGLSVDFTRGCCLKTHQVSGTSRYLAPEATLGRYSEAVDVWGLGIILYEVLSGVLAFSNLSSAAVVERLKAGADLAETLDWSTVSAGAKGLIMQMLKRDPEERLTIEKILDHPWIAQAKKRKGDDSNRAVVSEDPVVRKRRKMNHLMGNWSEVRPCAAAG